MTLLRLIDPVPSERTARTTNALVNGLPREDAAALMHIGARLTLRSGEQAELPGGGDALWFPETAVLSFGETLADRHVECGIVGREGAIGWEPLVGLTDVTQRVTALIGGTALGLRCEALVGLCARRPALAATMLRFREALMTQMRWTIAARLQYGPDRRLARWLCMLHDRVDGDTLDITHLRLAAFLNARRASVTDSLHLLEGERVVRCTRGKIFIRDREALEAAAGAGYGAAEHAYRDLVGPFGKTARFN